jgi:DNA-binding CsgD family transcriptional regulator
LLAEISGDPHTTVIRPGRLSPQASAELVRGRLGKDAAPTFVDACHRATDGNPLLLLQLLRALELEKVKPDAAHAETVIAIGSRAIGSLVTLRLRRLPGQASAVAKAVSVLGDRAELPVVATLVSASEQDVADAVAALARAELLTDQYPLGFVHPLVAEAVYQSLGAGEQASLHESAAQLLLDAGHPAEQVAVHLLKAPRRGRPETVDLLLRAADQAESRGSVEAATTFLRRALEEPPPEDDVVDLLVRTAVLGGTSDGVFARQTLERAYALCSDVEQRGEIALWLASALVFVGTEGEATSFALSAATELPVDAVDQRQALIALARVSGWIHDLPPDRWMGELDVTPSGFGARMLAVEQAFELSLRGTDRRRMLDLLRDALDDPTWQTGAADVFYEVAGIALIIAGEDTTEHWGAAMASAQARGETSTVGLHLWRGVALWLGGQLREAQQAVLSARYETEEWGSAAIGVPLCDAVLVLVALDLGDLTGARDLLDRALDAPGIGTGRRLLHVAHASVLLAEGDRLAALNVIDTFLPEVIGMHNPGWDTSRLLRADALTAQGEKDAAREILRVELQRAEHWGAPVVTGTIERRIAELDASLELARHSVTLTEPRPLEQVRALLVLAELTPDAGERATSLQRALEIVDECRAGGLREQVAQRLAASGVTPPRPPTPRETLTELELRALQLFDSGTCVDDVARALFVAPRTVEVLVAGARQRLGVQPAEPLAL